MSAEVGSEAPDFTLRDYQGEEVTLSDHRGGNVVLVFFPFAFSGICTKELSDVTSVGDQLGGATVLGISIDSPFALKAFRATNDLSARLLSDFEPKGEVARRYGVYVDGVGAATRATFVIDKEGKIAHATVNDLATARDANEVVEALAACPV
jgi:peroxiredoxin